MKLIKAMNKYRIEATHGNGHILAVYKVDNRKICFDSEAEYRWFGWINSGDEITFDTQKSAVHWLITGEKKND